MRYSIRIVLCYDNGGFERDRAQIFVFHHNADAAPRSVPFRPVVHIYHNYCLYTFTSSPSHARRLVTYAVVSAKPRANNIKIWFLHAVVTHSPILMPRIDRIIGQKVARYSLINSQRADRRSRSEYDNEGWWSGDPTIWRSDDGGGINGGCDRNSPRPRGGRYDRMLTWRGPSQMDSALGLD